MLSEMGALWIGWLSTIAAHELPESVLLGYNIAQNFNM